MPIACLALAVALLLPAATALGDADPPSDILVGFDAYYPYTPKVPRPLQAKLAGVLRATRANKHVYKVALIGGPADLGAATALYGHPQRYGTFLFNEIRGFLAGQEPTLVVVTRQGIALRGKDATPAGRAALEKLRVSANPSTPSQFVDTAVAVVRAIAAANGHSVPANTVATDIFGNPIAGKPSNSTRWVWIVVLVVALAVGLVSAVLLRNRLRRKTTTDVD